MRTTCSYLRLPVGREGVRRHRHERALAARPVIRQPGLPRYPTGGSVPQIARGVVMRLVEAFRRTSWCSRRCGRHHSVWYTEMAFDRIPHICTTLRLAEIGSRQRSYDRLFDEFVLLGLAGWKIIKAVKFVAVAIDSSLRWFCKISLGCCFARESCWRHVFPGLTTALGRCIGDVGVGQTRMGS